MKTIQVTRFNRILDNAARTLYQSAIDELFQLCPAMMARKIPEANIQQAFVFDTVQRFAAELATPKILCVGAFEDTAAAGLKAIGLPIEEIDPRINWDLQKFYRRSSTPKNYYDIIFSTSVLEHVKDDETFLRQIVDLLRPGGVGVLTCDYNDSYAQGDRIPQEDFRFYTQRDFRQRLAPALAGSAWVDEPQWDCPHPDFQYAGCHYTFASLVFRKQAKA